MNSYVNALGLNTHFQTVHGPTPTDNTVQLAIWR